MASYELDTTVLGGLPVTVRFEICKPEPYIGIYESYVDGIELVAINGKRKPLDWLERQLVKRGEWVSMLDNLLEQY